MKTAKNIQMLDSVNNNISPATGLESLYYEKQLDTTANIYRYPVYNKVLLFDEMTVDSVAEQPSYIWDISIKDVGCGDVSCKFVSLKKKAFKVSTADVDELANRVTILEGSVTSLGNAQNNINSSVQGLNSSVQAVKASNDALNVSALKNAGDKAALSQSDFDNGYFWFNTDKSNSVFSVPVSGIADYISGGTGGVSVEYLQENYWNKTHVDTSAAAQNSAVALKLDWALGSAVTPAAATRFYISSGSASASYVEYSTLKASITSGITAGVTSSVIAGTDTAEYYLLASSTSAAGTETAVNKTPQVYMKSGALYYTSDEKLKKDITGISGDQAEKIWASENGLIHDFTWKASGVKSTGFIAQELAEYIPEAVNIADNSVWTVNYDAALAKLTGVLFKKVKEMQSEIDSLKAALIR